MAKVKSDGRIWTLEFKRYVCFSFRGNRTIFGWDIANSIFDLEISRSRSWPWSNPMVTLSPQVRSIYMLFVSWQSDHFWLRYSKFHIWPWKFKVKVTTKIGQNLIRYCTGQGQQSCQNERNPKSCSKVIAWTRICGLQRRRRRTNRHKNIKSPPVYRGDLIMSWCMWQGFTHDQSTLVQVIAWYHQATNHYLNQCGPRSMSPYGVTRVQ